jgi:hypothetical protein
MEIRHGISAMVAASLLLSLGSCSEKKSSDDNTISFETITGSGSFKLMGSGENIEDAMDMTYGDSVSLVMPVSIYGKDITALRDSILVNALDSVGKDIHDIIARKIRQSAEENGYPVAVDDKKTPIFERDGYSVTIGSIIALNSDILTYCISSNVYSPGAAHGYTSAKYLTYYIPEAKILTLGDIFTPDGLKELPSEIQKQAEENISVIGPTEIEDLPAGNNFYISHDGEIVFVYQPYEVASFAQGEIKVAFYPYEIANYMTKTAIEHFGLDDLD